MRNASEEILDLTKPLSNSLEIYEEGDYRDPAFSCVEWCSVEKQGYLVSALSLGTQTGTHIDAPAHFDASGNCLDALSISNLIGQYFLIDLPQDTSDEHAKKLCAAYCEEPILFVWTKPGTSYISRNALDVILDLPPIVWVVAGHLELSNGAHLEFHRILARQGKYLIENVDLELADKVAHGGELIALPLRLVGTSGAPCRVVIRQSSVE